MKNDWESLKKSRDSIQRLRDEIASLELKAEEMTYNGEYSKVAELRYSKIPEKKKQLEVLEKDSKSDQTVRSDDIAKIVEKWTGIPVGKLLEKDAEIYAHLEENLRDYVIGQEKAIQKVSNALRRSKAGLADPKRPIGSFLFLGPTGVGKTETAKALCRILWNDPNAYIRLDMSEYMEAHSVSRLI